MRSLLSDMGPGCPYMHKPSQGTSGTRSRISWSHVTLRLGLSLPFSSSAKENVNYLLDMRRRATCKSRCCVLCKYLNCMLASGVMGLPQIYAASTLSISQEFVGCKRHVQLL